MEKIFWNRLYVPDSEAESEVKRLSNWLDYKKECELWHYEGCHTSRYLRWEKKHILKQRRARLGRELTLLRKEFEAGVTGGD